MTRYLTKNIDGESVSRPYTPEEEAEADATEAEAAAFDVANGYKEARQKPKADGGYGTWQEQMEILGEQGIAAYQAHIASVKTNIRKPE